MTENIEIDLSRFATGRAYVLNRTIVNTKIDRRLTRGGPELAAHRQLPMGLRFVLDVVERREGRNVVREYTWTADHSEDYSFRYLRLKAFDRTILTDPPARHVWLVPAEEYFPEHHRVVREAIEAMELEPASIASLAARAAEYHATGWEVIEHLISRGLISLSHVETSVDHLVGAQLSERAENIREHERTKEGQP